MKHFYTSEEVKLLLDLNSLRTAQNRIKAMNDALAQKGYWTEPGKVPVTFFHEKYPYIEMEAVR